MIIEGQTERVLDVTEVFTIGRSSKSDLVIDQLDCSRQHAELRRLGEGKVVLVDLGSRNGCYVNGVRIEGRHTLEDGDRIDIAEVILRFACDPPESASARGPAGVDLGVSLDESTAVLAGTGPDLFEGVAPLSDRDDGVCAIVVVADITDRKEIGPERASDPREAFVVDWIRDVDRVLERSGAARYHSHPDSGARMSIGYWLVDQPENPKPDVRLALRAVRQAIALAVEAAPLVAAGLGGASLVPAIGMHLGTMYLDPLPGARNGSWEISGEALDSAASLRRTCERLRAGVLVSGEIVGALPGLAPCTAPCAERMNGADAGVVPLGYSIDLARVGSVLA